MAHGRRRCHGLVVDCIWLHPECRDGHQVLRITEREEEVLKEWSKVNSKQNFKNDTHINNKKKKSCTISSHKSFFVYNRNKKRHNKQYCFTNPGCDVSVLQHCIAYYLCSCVGINKYSYTFWMFFYFNKVGEETPGTLLTCRAEVLLFFSLNKTLHV